MQSLFRPEAVAHATGRLEGAVLLPAPLAAWSAIAIVASVLVLGVWFAATATYSRQQSVPGWLSPQGGVARAVAGRSGTVNAIFVAEGDIVEAGRPLARIGDPSRIGTGVGTTRSASLAVQHGATGDDLVVNAPIGGRVEALAVHVGQSMPRGGTVAVLAATDELIAELLVPPAAVGLVAVGQTMALTYDALPLGRRRIQHGTVTDVSRTALAPEETGYSGLPVIGPVFRVRVRLPDQRLDGHAESVRLRAGTSLTAEITGHRRTLFESLFDTDEVAP